jgi:hypothetical protein
MIAFERLREVAVHCPTRRPFIQSAKEETLEVATVEEPLSVTGARDRSDLDRRLTELFFQCGRPPGLGRAGLRLSGL